MYPRAFAGVVIPDEYDEEQAVVIADDPYVHVYSAQGYGDDGLMDGAEGLGIVQAQRLKAKLRGRRRRLRVGRQPYAVVGGSTFDYGFGVAPLAVAGAAKSAGIKISLKKGRPRMFGGPLVDTVKGVQAKVEAGDLSAIRRMDEDRKRAKDRKAWQRIWNEVVPTWQYTPQGYALLKSLDAGFPGAPPSSMLTIAPPPVTQPGVTVPPPTVIPVVTQPGLPAPAPGPVTDAAGGPAPFFPAVPSPVPAGGPPTPSEQITAAIEEGGVVAPQRAGLFDAKTLVPLMVIGGVALVLFGGKGGGRRRRRSRR